MSFFSANIISKTLEWKLGYSRFVSKWPVLAIITYFRQWLQRLLLLWQRAENDLIKIETKCNVIVQKCSHTFRSSKKEYESTFQNLKKPVTCLQCAMGSISFLPSISSNMHRKHTFGISAALSLLVHRVQHLLMTLSDARRQCRADAKFSFWSPEWLRTRNKNCRSRPLIHILRSFLMSSRGRGLTKPQMSYPLRGIDPARPGWPDIMMTHY